ncbi:TKPR1 [Scenedesmus sp. PABB004]|nr:TKPR1 [Scenedesmus sp. PABB004]
MAELVCVTGATGYVASELVKQLLAAGGGTRYRVRATVRADPSSPRLQYLRDLPGAAERLELVRVPDLAAPGDALAAALDGARLLFHVASPFRFDGDPTADIVQPAVQGTRAVLTAAAAVPGLRRVVVTSSVCGAGRQPRAVGGRWRRSGLRGELWQDRLVAALLQQVAAGAASPWAPYVRALPRAVEASWRACPPDAIGGADLATFRWAHSVVMSRTFGNAGRGGGVGVRLLCPLIDMLNHAGDETPSGLHAPAAAPVAAATRLARPRLGRGAHLDTVAGARGGRAALVDRSAERAPEMAELVCVTGATGYVASELVKQLLAAGGGTRYRVRATVRADPSSPRLQYLRDLPGAAERLELVRVPDLAAPGDALAAALDGARLLFHVASPFRFDGDPTADIVQPAVQGTRAVLTAAAAVPGLRRVVVTSSVCAIHDMNRKQPPKGAAYCEDDWNEVSTLESEAYWVSKVQAERAAWALADDLGLDVVTILPNFVLGPVVSGGQGGVSVGFMRGILEAGRDAPLEGSWTINDVRDVAAAHILAAERPEAKGRYIVSQPESISARFITDTLKAAFPAAAAALADGGAAEANRIDSSRAVRELGLRLTPVAETVRDMAASLLEHGIAKPAWFTAVPAS